MRQLRWFTLGLLAVFSPAAGQKITPAQLAAWSHDVLPAAIAELDETLRIPNNALVPEDVANTIAWTRTAFTKRGFRVEQLPTGGPPLLLATREVKKPAATVLFYLHLDGQPVDSSKWQQASPYIPVIKKYNGSEWLPVSPDELAQGYDDDWRIFARSSSDDTGPVVMFLQAIDLIDAHKIKPNYNIKMIMDLEEEAGSRYLAPAVQQHAAKLRADYLVIFDGPRHITNRPTLSFGARGIATITLTVFGPRVPLHSGHYGNYAPNPAARLAALLASMKDDQGRVTIPGYYDGITLTTADKALLARVPDDEALIKKQLGIATADQVGHSLQEALQYPSLNIRGLSAGWVGAQARTIVPATATAEIDIRLVPESDGLRLLELVKKHIENQGYHIIAGDTPSEEERATYDKLIAVHSEFGYPAFRTPVDSPIGHWLSAALQTAFDQEPVKIRIMGGSVPISPLVKTLGAPAVGVPVVNPDNNQHSPNENLRIGNLREGIMTFAAILATPVKKK
ncbi:MAG TPA: M20/M25/M40 family metallo-hydrolase [Flammeovirgaceae bacterium]|nr:M20/M25/M40 family metallo-hydrolase [Flammeovirgaceae bacterium]